MRQGLATASVLDARLAQLAGRGRSRSRRLLREVAELLAVGRTLPEYVWRGRHRIMLVLLWANAAGVLAFAVAMGYALEHALLEAAVVAGAAGAALIPRLPIRARSVAAAFGMLATSALLVHFSGGYIEAHFHFFVAIMFIALYQDWAVFLVALVFVLAHHGIVGVLDPASVYNHDAARSTPWLWAGIHTGFVALASAANVLAWRLYEPLQDPLTGLATPPLFMKRVTRVLRDRSRQAALLFIDLDEFKAVNDTVGHSAGDQLLRLVARRIQIGLREGDTAARLGGDEFALLLTSVRGRHHALALAEEINAAIRRPFEVGSSSLVVHASVGVALTRPGEQGDAGQLLHDADLAMYAAKRDAGGPRVFEPAMHDRLVARSDLRAELRRALAVAELDVHYQAVVRCDTALIVGAEALVRWPHPSRGWIPPSAFVPEAEAAGLVGEIGQFVLERALTDVARWRSDGRIGAGFQVRVNVSARELEDETYVTRVARELYSSGVPASALVLEVTESLLADDVRSIVVRLGALKALGVRVSIDDFGSGYSSYRYLHELPVDELKVDRAFVRAMTQERGSHAIVRSMIVLAHDLGLEVVVEGVEDAETLEAVTALGSEHAQGFLLGRPMPTAGMEELLDARASALSPVGGSVSGSVRSPARSRPRAEALP